DVDGRQGAVAACRLAPGVPERAAYDRIKSLRSAIELGRWAGPVLGLAPQGVGEALLDEALADAGDGGEANVEGLGDALVSPGRAAVGLVGLEQDAGMGQPLGRGLAGGGQVI